MKTERICLTILSIILSVATVFSLSACMNKEDYYTKDDVDALVSELEKTISSETDERDSAIKELINEYEEKIAQFEAEDAANEKSIETLTAAYNAKVAELEAADEKNSSDLAALKTDYEAKVAEINASISANAEKISALETSLDEKIAEINESHNTKIESIEALITTLQNEDTANATRMAALELQVEQILSAHEHVFGEWVDYSGNGNIYCENRLFYRICGECNVLEWKAGTYDDHSFTTVTVDPTCVAQGYDEHTCSICGKVEKDNFTNLVNHTWLESYSSNASFHWLDCKYCDATDSYGEHTAGEDGFCTSCDIPISASEGLIYSLSSDKSYAELIGYKGTATRVIVADDYEGVPVRKIHKDAFVNNTIIISVVIPDTVTSIGDHAFWYCTSLTSVTIGDGVTSIGNYAFYNCTSLTSVNFGENSQLTSIGEGAFEYCTSLTSVAIPDSVTSIGSYAFCGCTSLTSITIPDSVTSIGEGPFYGCTSLTSITVDENNTAYRSIDGNLYTKDGKTLVTYATGKTDTSFTIPVSVTGIGSYAFYGCTSLTSITIPDSVTSIGSAAFYKCTSLTSVTIPDSVTSIDNSAFSGCTSLTSATFKNTEGWWILSSSAATSGTEINVSDATTAATYLRSTYLYYYWKRG